MLSPIPLARRVLVISGRRLIAEALQELLRLQTGVEGCEVACEVAELRHAVASLRPSTLIVDLDQPGCTRDELADALATASDVRRIGVYDTFTSPYAQMAFELGLTVLLPLTSTLDHLVEHVLADPYHSSSITAAVGLTPQELARLASLTARELEVLNHIARGRPVKAVAGLLGITVHTVETHKRRCFAKLGVQQQAHAVALATSAGMILSE